MPLLTAKHSHQFVVWTFVYTPTGALQTRREVHRFTHKHDVRDLAHLHRVNGATHSAAYYADARETHTTTDRG